MILMDLEHGHKIVWAPLPEDDFRRSGRAQLAVKLRSAAETQLL